jgi:hypothetical protein
MIQGLTDILFWLACLPQHRIKFASFVGQCLALGWKPFRSCLWSARVIGTGVRCPMSVIVGHYCDIDSPMRCLRCCCFYHGVILEIVVPNRDWVQYTLIGNEIPE